MQIFVISFLLIFIPKISIAKERIIGGYEISIEQVPHQVALLYNGDLRCGGSIISCNFVVTAAHCTYSISQISSLTIRSGSSQHAKGGTIHGIFRVDIHPSYDRFLYDYDVSILTLKTRIVFDEFRKPINLPYQNEPLLPGSFVSTSGWGLTYNVNETTENLRSVELTVVKQNECFKAYQNDGGITTRMVCAAASSKDACDGDSGGGLVDVKTRKLVGIVSFGPFNDCAVNGIPGVYARVASLRQWIRQITKI